MAISDKPWSNFSDADYSEAQLAKASLIHDESATGKAAYKLRVREPDGTLNRNGVYAAAAALAGARTTLQATPAQKKTAARKLLALYHEIGKIAPDSVYKIAGEKPPKAKGA